MISLLTFLPFERYTIETTLNQQGIVEKLRSVTQKKKALRLDSSKYFEGTIERDNFTINKIHPKSDYFPIISGHVVHAISHKKIYITMRLSILYSVGLLLVIPLLYLMFYHPSFPLSKKGYGWWIPTMITIVIYTAITIFFKMQTIPLKKELNKLFFQDKS